MRYFALGFALLLFSGCASAPKKQKKIKPDKTLINIPRCVPGVALSDDDLAKLRTGEQVEAYVIGRYVDPNDPSIMYESNTAYRVGSSPYWIKTPRPLKNPPTGVPLGLRSDPANRPLITEFRHDLQVLKKADGTMRSATAQLAAAKRKCEILASRLAEKLKNLEVKTSESKKLEAKVAELEAKIADIESRNLFESGKKENGKK